jgi:hypothetical protein
MVAISRDHDVDARGYRDSAGQAGDASMIYVLPDMRGLSYIYQYSLSGNMVKWGPIGNPWKVDALA